MQRDKLWEINCRRSDYLLRSHMEKESSWMTESHQPADQPWNMNFHDIMNLSRNCKSPWSFCLQCFGDVYSKTVTQDLPFRKRITGNPILESFLHIFFFNSQAEGFPPTMAHKGKGNGNLKKFSAVSMSCRCC